MYDRRKFTILLVALLLMLVGYPLITYNGEIQILYRAFQFLVLLAALLVLFQQRRQRILAVVSGTATALSVVLGSLLPGLPPVARALFLHLVPVILLGIIVVTVVKITFARGEVSADSVNGAFCGYLLIGLAFGHLYCLVETLYPGSFLADGRTHAVPGIDHRRHFILTYYSLITLTTVGYGDVTANSDPARSLSWLEAVMGQFYIAVILAEVIALKVAKAISDRENIPPRPGGEDSVSGAG